MRRFLTLGETFYDLKLDQSLKKLCLEYIVYTFPQGASALCTEGGTGMLTLLRKFRRNESGATAIEYALIVALISVVAITAYTNIGTNLNTKMTSVQDALK